MNSIIDILKNGNAADSTIGVVEEAIKTVPEVAFFSAKMVKGNQFQSLARTELPTASFRAIGAGTDATGSNYVLRTFKMAVLDCLFKRDKAAIDADFEGKEKALTREAAGIVAAGFMRLGKAAWNATEAVEGFDGAGALCKAANVLDAQGAGNKTFSVYAVGNGVADGCGLTFQDGKGLFAEGDIEFKEGLIMGTNGKELMGYIADLTSWAGFACTNANRIARLKGISKNGTSGGTFLDDDLIGDLVDQYVEANNGVRPDALFMPFALRTQLRKSRKLTIQTAAGDKSMAYPSTPADFDGIPIIGTPCLGEEGEG